MKRLLKNNLIYFMINMLLISVCIFIDNTISYLSIGYINVILVDTLEGTCILILFLAAGYFSKYRKTPISNFLSFSFVGLFGIMIWFICKISSPNIHADDIGIWKLYLFYNIGAMPLLMVLDSLKRDVSQYWLGSIGLSFIPWILFWAGLELKAVKLKLFPNKNNPPLVKVDPEPETVIKKPLIVIFILFVSIMVGLIIEFSIFVYTPAKNPEFAIRKEVFSWGRPIKALTVKVKKEKLNDKRYGHLFYVEELKDYKGDYLSYFYLKQKKASGMLQV